MKILNSSKCGKMHSTHSSKFINYTFATLFSISSIFGFNSNLHAQEQKKSEGEIATEKNTNYKNFYLDELSPFLYDAKLNYLNKNRGNYLALPEFIIKEQQLGFRLQNIPSNENMSKDINALESILLKEDIMNDGSNFWKKALVFSNIPIVGYIIHELYDSRFKDVPKTNFHFVFSNDYARNLDKFGNAYYCYLLTLAAVKAYKWAEFNNSKALILAGGLNVGIPFLWAKYHEGFYSGTEILDLVSGGSGILLALVQANEEDEDGFFNRINFEWGFVPRASQHDWTPGPGARLTDRYDYQIFALKFRIGDLITDKDWVKPLSLGVTTQLRKDGKGLLYKFIFDYQILDKIYIPISPAIWIDEQGKLRFGISMQH